MEVRINWQLVSTALMLMNFVGTIGVAVWVWLRSPSEANTERLDKHDQELEDLRRETGERLVAIESKLEFIPTVNDMGTMQADVRAVKATQDAFQRELHQARLSLNRIEDFLMKK